VLFSPTVCADSLRFSAEKEHIVSRPAAASRGKRVAAVAATDKLHVHGVSWRDGGEVSQDVVTSTRETRLKWPQHLLDQADGQGGKKELHYFLLMFPLELVPQTVCLTNDELRRKHHSGGFDEFEFWKYLGLRLAMTISGVVAPVKWFWEVAEDPETFFRPMNFGGRFGMARHRFEEISECLRFDTFESGLLDQVSFSPCL
jgi:hypothetical protein